MAQMSKREQLEHAVFKFKNSQKTTEDYFDLIVAGVYATRMGDGLVWSEVKEVLELLEEKTETIIATSTENTIMNKRRNIVNGNHWSEVERTVLKEKYCKFWREYYTDNYIPFLRRLGWKDEEIVAKLQKEILEYTESLPSWKNEPGGTLETESIIDVLTTVLAEMKID